MSEDESSDEQNFIHAVILLHGLGRGIGVMRKLDHYLSKNGFETHNIDYESTEHTIEEHVEHIRKKIQPIVDRPNVTVHFIGHSLGALIIRYLIQHYPLKNMGRVVMLAPPNQGTVVADFMEKFWFYRKLYGPAGGQLGVKKNEFIHKLKLPDYEYGVIAGDRSIDKLFSWFVLEGPDDGKVTVESTKLSNMTDHLVVHATHTFLPSNKEVLSQCVFFLSHGYFQRFD